MKIYIADLGYLSPIDFEHTVPLNAGLIASYALKHIPDLNIEIFKDPNKLIRAVSSTPPNLLAFTHYMWNQNLNNDVIKRCKNYAPNLPIIMGGPNFCYDDKVWIIDFFQKRPLLDFYISGEGEKSFLKFVELFLNSNCDPDNINLADCPPTIFKYDHTKNELLNNHENTIGPVNLLDTPSPYLTGILDPFLKDEHFLPIIETNRGCPYDCAYCNWGRGMSKKTRQYDLSRVFDEIEYVAKWSKNPTKVLYFADANFGILKRDKEIAKAIMKAKGKHQFPRQLFAYAAKKPTRNTIDTFEIIKSINRMSVSIQSSNEKVLKTISRNNLNFESFKNILNQCKDREIQAYSEVIFALPGEDFDSFVKGVSKLLRCGQERIMIYLLRLHWGTRINAPEFRKKHGLKTAFRIHVVPPKENAGYDFKTVEYVEVVTGTNDISITDFFRYRDFHVLIALLSSHVFTEFRRGLKAVDSEIASISKMILDDEMNWPVKWTGIMNDYRDECKSELIPVEDAKEEFTEAELEKIKGREIFLVPACLCKFFARRENVREFKEYLLKLIHRRYHNMITDKQLMDLCQTLCISMDRAICYDQFQPSHGVSYEYDLDAWLADERLSPLSEFKVKEPITYVMEPHEGIPEAFEKAKQVGTSLENSVYLLKYNFFFQGDDKIFYYLRKQS